MPTTESTTTDKPTGRKPAGEKPSGAEKPPKPPKQEPLGGAEQKPPVSPPEPPAPARGRPRKAPLEGRLADFLTTISAGFMLAGDEHCATIIADRTDALAGAWGRLAKRNARIRKALESILSGGEWGEVVMVTAFTTLPIAAHHGLVPERLGMLGLLGFDDGDQEQDAGEPRPFAPTGGVGNGAGDAPGIH